MPAMVQTNRRIRGGEEDIEAPQYQQQTTHMEVFQLQHTSNENQISNSETIIVKIETDMMVIKSEQAVCKRSTRDIYASTRR